MRLNLISVLILSILNYYLVECKPQELKMIIELFRHGARESLGINANLTNVGMRQHYLLGAHLRQKYADLIPSKYQPNQVYTRSTNTNRTIMSAYAQLQGLFPFGSGPNVSNEKSEEHYFPPFFNLQINQPEYMQMDSALPMNYQPIPVHIMDQSQDYVLSSTRPLVCPNSNILKNEQLNSNLMKNFQRKMQPTIDELIQKGLLKQNSTVKDVADLVDSIISAYFADEPVPIDLESELYRQMRFISDFYDYYTKFGSTRQRQIFSVNFFDNIIKLFDDALNDKHEFKMVLYSGHDTNFAGILSVLNITTWECLQDKYERGFTALGGPYCFPPQFASNLIFELWIPSQENNLLGDNFPLGKDEDLIIIKVLYNDRVLRICHKKEFCTLNEFKETIQEATGNADFNDFIEFCHQKENLNFDWNSDDEKRAAKDMIDLTESWVLFLLICFGILILAAIGYIYILNNTYKKNTMNSQFLMI